VQQAPARHAGEQHGQAEIDDDVRILPDALGPDAAQDRREQEPDQQQHEVARRRDRVVTPERGEIEREQAALHGRGLSGFLRRRSSAECG
jgi:hypothetical protein